MDSVEVAKVNLYLAEMRSLRSMQTASLRVDSLEQTAKMLKTTTDALFRSKIMYSAELLDADHSNCDLRQESDRLEQLACKMMSLIEGAHTKIATLAEAVTKSVGRNGATCEPATDENAKSGTIDGSENVESNENMDVVSDEEDQDFRCDECPRKFKKMAALYRHGVRMHGRQSAAGKQQKLKRFKAKIVAEDLKRKRNIRAALKIFKSIVVPVSDTEQSNEQK